MKTWDEKTDHLLTLLPEMQDRTEHCRATVKMIMLRFKAIVGYEWNHSERIKSHTILLRPVSAEFEEEEEDYGLSKVRIFLLLQANL
jgi:hypothetical protein